MKLYDIVFAIAWAVGISALAWDKIAVEALISGLVMGSYIGWRLWHDIR